MSINQIDLSNPYGTTRRTPKTLPAAGAEDNFAQQLAASQRAKDSDPAAAAATAAEVLRLEMMKSAISLGTGDGEVPPTTIGTRALQEILAAFRSNAPAEAEQVATLQAAEPEARSQEPPPPAGAPRPLEDIIRRAANRYGVDEGLIKAVMKAESNFNPRAVSSAGAQGLMQLMPATARGLGVTDSFDPEQNVMAGTRFLKDMLKRYGGNVDSALAAYNWGPGNVDRRGASLPRETREYLVKVRTYYNEFSG